VLQKRAHFAAAVAIGVLAQEIYRASPVARKSPATVLWPAAQDLMLTEMSQHLQRLTIVVRSSRLRRMAGGGGFGRRAVAASPRSRLRNAPYALSSSVGWGW